MQKSARGFLLFYSTIVLLGFLFISCATTPKYTPEMWQKLNSIVVTTVMPQEKYRILGTVTVEAQQMFSTGVNPEVANDALKKRAFEIYGWDVDAVIGVQYSEIRGMLYDTRMGTRATGTAIKYTGGY